MRLGFETSPRVEIKRPKRVYISVPVKFVLSHLLALLWVGFSVYVSIPWYRP